VGGPGSGRRRTWRGVDECRALDLGELCDGGRLRAQPRGVVLWRARDGGALRARLTYAITGQESAADDLLLAYRYWPEGGGLCHENELGLTALPGRRTYAWCPVCGVRARTLFAPPGAGAFRCRECCGLVYRRSHAAEDRAYVSEVAGPATRALWALPARARRRPPRRYVERPPSELACELEAELPLRDEELRLWCLRLRACGLSYRQIAALTETSKSTAARICAAGAGAIDRQALVKERLERALGLPAPPDDDDPRALAAYFTELYRRSLRLGLHRLPRGELEERLVILPGEAAEP